jgi:hypothetical protein
VKVTPERAREKLAVPAGHRAAEREVHAG